MRYETFEHRHAAIIEPISVFGIEIAMLSV
jgi:hypothetical protein